MCQFPGGCGIQNGYKLFSLHTLYLIIDYTSYGDAEWLLGTEQNNYKPL